MIRVRHARAASGAQPTARAATRTAPRSTRQGRVHNSSAGSRRVGSGPDRAGGVGDDRGDFLDGSTMVAKAYRLLRAILMTAVDDGIIARNTCRIRGGGSEPTPERPVLSVTRVLNLADQMPPRYRLLVLVATFGSLRWGEVTAIRRGDVDPVTGVLRIRLAFAERSTGELVLGPPKSRAGIHAVTLPRPWLPLLVAHLDRYGPDDRGGLLFTGDKVARFVGATSTAGCHGRRSWPGLACRTCTFVTRGTRATPWRPPLGRPFAT